MKENLIDWFLNSQLKIIILLGWLAVVIIFFFDSRVFQALLSFLFSILLVFAGHKLYSIETAENWLKFSYLETLKSIFGGALMLIGWLIFFRRVLALAITSIILQFNG